MAETVYVLMLETGEYSDRAEDILGVFATADLAKRAAEADHAEKVAWHEQQYGASNVLGPLSPWTEHDGLFTTMIDPEHRFYRGEYQVVPFAVVSS